NRLISLRRWRPVSRNPRGSRRVLASEVCAMPSSKPPTRRSTSSPDPRSPGGLAGHLASEVPVVLDVLEASVGDARPIPLAEHYARAAWVTSTVDDEV